MGLFRSFIRAFRTSWDGAGDSIIQIIPGRRSGALHCRALDSSLDHLRLAYQRMAMSTLQEVFYWQLVVWQSAYERLRSSLCSLRLAEAGRVAVCVSTPQLAEGSCSFSVLTVSQFPFPTRSPNFTGTSIFFPPRYTVTLTVSPGRFRFKTKFISD